jgi:hypothetical protein
MSDLCSRGYNGARQDCSECQFDRLAFGQRTVVKSNELARVPVPLHSVKKCRLASRF